LQISSARHAFRAAKQVLLKAGEFGFGFDFA
jgi:hypothetical protein